MLDVYNEAVVERGGKGKFFEGKLGCANSRHAWIRACASLSLSVPSLYMSSINAPSALCAPRARRRIAYALLCTPASSANTELGQHRWHATRRMRGCTHGDANPSFSRIRFVNQFPIDPRFSFKKKKGKKRECISPIYPQKRETVVLLSISITVALFLFRGKLTKGGEKKRKTFHPSFIHVITSISISHRISNSLVPVCTYPRIYARVTRTSVSVVANIKEGRGARAGAPRENTGRGGEGAGFIHVHPVFRDTKHIGRLSL